MKKLILTLCLCLAASLGATAQQNDYQKTVEELISISGAGSTFQSIVPQMFDMMRQQIKNVPEAYWDEAEKEMTQTANAELAAMLVPVYQKYLSQQELDEIIAFYHTPAGKKLAESSPKISGEALAIGQQWGMQLGQKIYQQLKDKGYL